MKAIALFSGGLDSTLAMKLILDQGIEVIALNIDIGFGSTRDRTVHQQNMCDQIGVELRTVDTKEQYLREILFNPKHGYGKHFNPCIDCHGNMFRIAKAMLEPWGASFIISGEVVGQRPMSQRMEALGMVNALAGAEDIMLRPLSAKVLPPTLPEREGWIARDKLLGITGRNREVQLAIAQKIGLKNFESPGGGCLLTDAHFAAKIREFIRYDTLEVADIPLLKAGRHLRLPGGAKLVIGRHEADNTLLEKVDSPKYDRITLQISGPLSLISKNADAADKALAAKLCITYAKSTPGRLYEATIGPEPFYDEPFESKEACRRYFI